MLLAVTLSVGGGVTKRRHLRCADKQIQFPFSFKKDRIYTDILELLAYYYSQVLALPLSTEEIVPSLNFPKNTPKLAPLKGADYLCYVLDSSVLQRQYHHEKLMPLLIKYAQRHGLKIVVTAAKPQAELVKDERVVDLTGKTSLLQLGQVIAHAKVIIGNETGPTHLSWILNKPTVMLYGGGHFGLFRPSNRCQVVSVASRPCFACGWRCYSSIKKLAPCIDDISLSQIEQALEKQWP